MNKQILEQEIERFNQRFQNEKQEIIILTSSSTGGGGRSGQDILWNCSQLFLSYVDCSNNKIHKNSGRVIWLSEKVQESGIDFEPKTIYKVLVRKSKTREHWFKLEEILEENITNSQLADFLEDFEQPVIIKNEIGEFELDKEYHSFSGEIEWLDDKVAVILEDSNNLESGNKALNHLKTIISNTKHWNEQLAKFAALKLTENANDWQQESAEGETPTITETEFVSRISVSELIVTPEGELTAYFDDGDLFFGHVIIVDATIDGKFTDAYIAG